VDTARILVRGGHGGAGAVSFRRQPFEPRGGPDGGDGGRGGSVRLVASPSASSLAALARKELWVAGDGAPGGRGRKEGRQGAVLRIEVPPGTVVLDDASNRLLVDLDEPGAEFVVAGGGAGGRGNLRFASPTNRSPQIAEPGRPGEEAWIRLELKLIADAALVGPPNAGKSSLLRALSSAQPRVGEYPFTTLDPELGVATAAGGRRVVVADLPGLIEGASLGAGLGLRFLRHMERTRVLIYVADGAAADPWGDLEAVRLEVKAYSAALARRPALTVVNKIDLDPARRLKGRRRGVLYVSALTGEGIPELVEELADAVAAAPLPATRVVPTVARLRPRPQPRPLSVTQHSWGFEVSGTRIERLVARTDFASPAALERFQALLDRIGVNSALEEAGAAPGATVRIGEHEFEYRP
jgi:GTP-binding protein